ncbi:hypothetical protein ABL840_26855 [Variovorax sp. NFACC27]|uniref:hypothetical protein n=1 Tax=unclassified Variovorax TaxID=663243 RepID=UPI0008950DDA|nr:hypothetical protein SAMN03159371_03679 [Variovorax sp. NFACC28]SEG77996.1 hypothetical protein SAMN03159365_03758 [Variovorax sp. NFACC29]SFC96305.1 hypothetical protein SAMN03159379_03665 [Variovorax sp. NFACC26]SFG09344.1 hypothetical protein SAMN03159447_01773 [Variovorax sp. NFACC27]
MTVAETSAEAFHSLSPRFYLSPKEEQVMRLFQRPGVSLSRQQISQKARMPINGVCGRVDSLLAAGHLEERGFRIDPHTNKRQKLLRIPQPDQAQLFPETRPC